MEEKSAKLYVNTPNALAGNEESKCNNASPKFQYQESGIVDFIGSEADIFAQIRQLITMIPANNEDDMSYEECRDDLNRVCEDLENCIGDTSILISNIADDNVFVEVKAGHAKSMVTGFIKLNGVTIGCVANRTEVYGMDGKLVKEFDSVLCPGGCDKAADFVNFCDAFNIPILSFTNATGFKATVEAEKKIAKAVAKLTYAFAHANVPKVNVVIGKAYGSAYISMNSKSIGADIVYAWPNAEIGMMDAKLAAKIMYAGESVEVINEKAVEYSELQSSVISAAGRGYVDSIIEASDTRKYVIGAFEMLFTKREDRPGKKHGTI
jgi:acetyl-CoA carboxylase carboxyltransferase component